MDWRVEPCDPALLSAALDADPAHLCPPEAYWQRLRPHLPRFGISRVADITGLDRLGYPVVQAVRARARSNAVTQGKADTLAGAALGAVLECLEMAAGERPGALPPAQVPGDGDLWATLVPGGLGAADWPGITGAAAAHAPPPYVAAWDLTNDCPGAVPRDVVSTDFTKGARAEAAPILRVSNGLGAGASLAAALMHGLLEHIEADRRLRSDAGPGGRQITLDHADPTYGPLLARIQAAGLRVRAEDLGGIGPVSVVATSVMEAPGATGLPLPAIGYAARFSRSAAIAAALSEAVQARLAVIAGAREDLTQAVYAHGFSSAEIAYEWERHAAPAAMEAAPDPIPPAPPAPPRLRDLVAGMPGPIFAVPLHWEPHLPLAITRIVAPRLITDPLRLSPLWPVPEDLP